jgi:hypothetical protein
MHEQIFSAATVSGVRRTTGPTSRSAQAVYEIDGGLLQYEAERLAFRDTVQQWLALHPAPAREASRGCAHCRR